MKKIVTLVGARPQFVKAAVVSAELARRAGVSEVLIHTGQHYDANMSQLFFEELGLPVPAYNLGVGSGPQGQQTGRMLEGIETAMLAEQPDLVLVYGDTNSTLAGALAASKLHVPIAHVEAGLRSFNRRMPEEINRIVADHVADMLFAPTELAVLNLQKEGIEHGKIHLVGDVMYDVAMVFERKAVERSRVLESLGVEPQGFVLATIHRAENTDTPDRLRAIMEGLIMVAGTLPVVLPMHPRTRRALQGLPLLSRLLSTVQVVEPFGYLDMLMLEKHAALIATDSGGVQKEAFFFDVPCVTLRDETEWVELVDMGWNQLVPACDPDVVAAALLAAIGRRGRAGQPYGDGHAAEKIATRCLESMGG